MMLKAHYSLGLTYMQQGRIDEAIREYRTALRINPDYAKAHCDLGLAYGNRAVPRDEIREYQAAIRADSTNAYVHYNLGVAYGQQSRAEDEDAGMRRRCADPNPRRSAP